MATRPASKFAAAALAGGLALVGMASTASAEGAPTAKKQPAPTVRRHVPPVFGTLCAPGTVATPFEMPIYDDATGLWVIGHETVWFCVPADLEPAG